MKREVELIVRVEVDIPDPTVRGTHDGATLDERAVEYGFDNAAVAAAIQLVHGIYSLGGSDGWADFDRDAVRAWVTWTEPT